MQCWTSACQDHRPCFQAQKCQLISAQDKPSRVIEGAFIFINDVGFEFDRTYLDKELVAFEFDEPGDPASVAAAL